MNQILSMLAIGITFGLAACASSTQEGAIQLPGEATHSGLQVPPDPGERPVQTATASGR